MQEPDSTRNRLMKGQNALQVFKQLSRLFMLVTPGIKMTEIEISNRQEVREAKNVGRRLKDTLYVGFVYKMLLRMRCNKP